MSIPLIPRAPAVQSSPNKPAVKNITIRPGGTRCISMECGRDLTGINVVCSVFRSPMAGRPISVPVEVQSQQGGVVVVDFGMVSLSAEPTSWSLSAIGGGGVAIIYTGIVSEDA